VCTPRIKKYATKSGVFLFNIIQNEFTIIKILGFIDFAATAIPANKPPPPVGTIILNIFYIIFI
jgi:hypothetical protein